MSTSASGISNRAARQTYHPGGSGVSEGLARARKPFRTTNALTGAVIAGFALSVYLYSIRAVAQDDFSDVPAPTLAQREGVRSLEDEQKEREMLKEQRRIGLSSIGAGGQDSTVVARAQEAEQASRALDRGRGLGAASALDVEVAQAKGAVARTGMTMWERLAGNFGGKGTDSAFVHGAPPVDRLGTVSDKAGVPVGQVQAQAQAQATTRRLV